MPERQHFFTSHFSNRQQDSSDLPRIGTIQFQGLQKEYLTVELLSLFFFWFLVSVGFILMAYFRMSDIPNHFLWIGGIAIITVSLASLLLRIYGFKRKKFAIREKDILYKEGLIWRSLTVIPFNRVQHAEVHQGPVERLFQLSRLKIYTAGGSTSDMTIAGLEPEEAYRMKHFILSKTSEDEEE